MGYNWDCGCRISLGSYYLCNKHEKWVEDYLDKENTGGIKKNDRNKKVK